MKSMQFKVIYLQVISICEHIQSSSVELSCSIYDLLCSVLCIIVCSFSFGHCVACPFSFGHCVACPSSTCDYLFGIFKLFLSVAFMKRIRERSVVYGFSQTKVHGKNQREKPILYGTSQTEVHENNQREKSVRYGISQTEIHEQCYFPVDNENKQPHINS